MAGMDVNAKLTLDASNFDANMRKSADGATATGRAAEKAARLAAAAQAEAAKFVGDTITMESRRALNAIQARTVAERDFNQIQKLAQRGLLDEAQAADAAAAAYQRRAAARKAVQAAEATHPEVSSRMAASAAVRGLETGNVGIRSVENLLTTIPGVSAGLMTLFPILGTAGLVGAFVEMGEKGVEALHKVQRAAYETRDAFQATHDRALVSIDDLEIQNQKIQDQIAKISGHPNNGLASALLEAKKMADGLVVSLQADRKELEELLKEHDTGMLGNVLSVVGLDVPTSTKQQQKELLNDQSGLITAIRNATVERDAAAAKLTDPKDLKANVDRYAKAVHDIYQVQIDAYRVESKRLKDEQDHSDREIVTRTGVRHTGPTINNSEKIFDVEGRAKQLEDAQRIATLQAGIFNGNVDLGNVKQKKELGEESKKADERRLKEMEAEYAVFNAMGTRTAEQDRAFWDARIGEFTKGSAQYNTIVEKQSALTVEARVKIYEELKRIKARDKAIDAEAPKDLDRGLERWRLDDRKNFDDKIDASNEANAVAARNAAREREVSIGEASGRTMTREAAAAALAATHTAAFGAELDRLLAKRKMVSESTWLTDDEKTRAVAGLDTQIADQRSSRAIQMSQDAFAMNPADTTLLTGIRQAVIDFTASSKDLGKAVENVLGGALNSTNEGIIRSITTRHTAGEHIWGNVGGDIFRNVAGASLRGAEGSALNAFSKTKLGAMFGLSGKAPTGAAGDPLHVVMGGAAGGQGGASGVTSLLSGIGGKVGGFFGGLGSFASKLFGAIPGFADGTDNFGGGLALVGERGPELLRLPRGSAVTPNHRLGSTYGRFGDLHVHVDARGASDPAQIEAAAHRAVMKAAPSIMAGANARHADHASRQLGAPAGR